MKKSTTSPSVWPARSSWARARGRAHRRERPALARAAPLPRMRQGLRLLRHGEPGAPRLWRAMDLARSACYLSTRPAGCAARSTACAPRPSPGSAARGALHATSRTGWRGWRSAAPPRRSRARPRRVAQRGRRVQARLHAELEAARRLEVRRRAPHRHRRRSSYKKGPQVRHGGRRPRPRLPHLGARGPARTCSTCSSTSSRAREQARAIEVVTADGAEADGAAGQAPLPQREVGHGPLPRGPVDERRARRRALRGGNAARAAARAARPRPEGKRGRPAAKARLPPGGGQGARRRRRPPSRAAATRS